MVAEQKLALSRRRFLKVMAALGSCAAVAKEMFLSAPVRAQAPARGMPLPDEPLEAMMKRVFTTRPLLSGEGRLTLEVPLIAEDGGNVPIAVEANLPVSGAPRLIAIYVISDQNRLPLLAKFTFTPESGKAFIATSIRLAATTEVRAVAEMSDGTLYAVNKHVRVAISGCDFPPPG